MAPKPPKVSTASNNDSPKTSLDEELMFYELSSNFTDSQLLFFEKYLEHHNIKKALAEANYSASAYADLSALLKRDTSIAYMKMLRRRMALEAALNPSEVIAKTRKIYDSAFREGDYKVAMDATKYLGSILGMVKEKGSESASANVLISGNTPKEIAADNATFSDILAKCSKDLNKPNVPSAIKSLVNRSNVIDVTGEDSDDL